MVRNYTSAELLNRVGRLPTFSYFPDGYWILGVRSKADKYDTYDDKFYLFKGKEFIIVMTGTTNSGGYGLMNFAKWDPRGTATVKADEWYYEAWQRGFHRGTSGSVKALRQFGPFKIIRDNNKNKKSGDIGIWKEEKNIGINFHPNTYNLKKKGISWLIGGWSVGCQVINDVPKYVRMLELTEPQSIFSYVLINEF